MGQQSSVCSVCQRSFKVRFRYQVREEAGTFVHLCSQICQQASLTTGAERPTCSVCAKSFELEYAYQASVGDGAPTYFCSTHCQSGARAGVVRLNRAGGRAAEGPRRIAVFNHKGGTGKTTTAVNLAGGLAEKGLNVLLVDVDGQGNVGASLGIAGERSLYHVLVAGASAYEATVPVRPGLDVLTSNETLAAAELHLATLPNRHRVLRECLSSAVSGYDVIVLDCAPALSLMNQNALVYADSVLVPVSCDYLSLVGVRQVLKTLKNVRTLLKHDVRLLGVLPTFYDVRNKISRESVAALQEHFGERCLPPIRINTKLREAPSAKQTIFEYAPQSHGAQDYLTLVDRIKELRGDPSLLDTVGSPERARRAS